MRAIATLVPLIVLVAVASLAPAARAQDAALLRWRWRVGERLTYRVRSITATTFTAAPRGGTPTAVSVDETWTLDVDPREVNAEGAARLDITHRAVRFELLIDGVVKDAQDSERAAIRLDTPLGRSESAMLGVTVTASVRASGLVEGLLMPHGSIIARARRLGVEKPDAAFADSAIVSRLELLFHVLPATATALAGGDAWTVRRRLDSWPGAAIERVCTYSLRGVDPGDDGRAMLGVQTALEVKEEPGPEGLKPATRVTAETSDVSGGAVFDARRGALLSLEQKWSTKMTTRTPIADARPGAAAERIGVNLMHNENFVELVQPPAAGR